MSDITSVAAAAVRGLCLNGGKSGWTCIESNYGPYSCPVCAAADEFVWLLKRCGVPVFDDEGEAAS